MKIHLLYRIAILLSAFILSPLHVSVATDTADSSLPDTAKMQLSQLQSANPKIRREAADTLGDAGSTAAAPYILPLLKDTDEYVRQAAARALGEIKYRDAVEPLIKALKDPDPYVRSYAVWALGEINDPGAVEPLLPLIYDKDEKVRQRSSEAVMKFKTPEARRSIIKELVRGVQHDSRQSETMLWQMIEREGESVLLNAFADPVDNETKTIRNYIKALSIHDSRVHPIIEKGLIEHKNRTLVRAELADYIKNEQPATDALYFLGKFKDPAVFPLFKDLLKGPPSTVQNIAIPDPNPVDWNITDERLLAVQSRETSKRRILVLQLGFMDCPEAADELRVIAADEREHLSLRGDAAEALGRLKDAGSVDTLIAILQNDKNYWRFRISAAKALGDIRDRKAVDPLIAVLKNAQEQKWLRFEAAGSLGTIGDVRAAESLEQAAHDKDPAVSNRARESLARVRGKK